jgi:DNA-binding transcriptional MerR regulator
VRYRQAVAAFDQRRRGGRPIRISQLAAASGVSVATIKYYLREGLLPPGRATAPNQATYDEAHLRRLRLVRVLREVGGVGIDAIGQVVAAIDDPQRSLHEVLGAAHRAISPGAGEGAPPPDPGALAEVDDLVARLGWQVAPDAAALAELARALSLLRGLGLEIGAEAFEPYARAVDPIAAAEVAGVPRDAPRDEAVEYLVVGTVVFGAVMAALRRLAQEHHSATWPSDAGSA